MVTQRKESHQNASRQESHRQKLAGCLSHSNSIIFDKTFTLCCKLFEYVFEPVIADESSLFYGIGFISSWRIGCPSNSSRQTRALKVQVNKRLFSPLDSIRSQNIRTKLSQRDS
jgi:hypothetical protein